MILYGGKISIKNISDEIKYSNIFLTTHNIISDICLLSKAFQRNFSRESSLSGKIYIEISEINGKINSTGIVLCHNPGAKLIPCIIVT